MGVPRKLFSFISLLVAILSILELISVAKSESDYTTLIYKGCAKQSLSDPSGVSSQALSSLFGTLVAQSSKAKFSKTTTGSSQNTVTGLFQCRGDLSNVDCYNCVSRLPILIDKLCGKPVAARIQLFGCYMLYEIAGFPQISGMEMLYKTCSRKNAPGSGFEEKRDTALSNLAGGISGASGFYSTSYEAVYALGQCEGDVGNADCADCVKNAVQRAQVECGSSVSGQIFLHKCFISYSYYPNGVPKGSSSSSSSFSSPSSTSASSYSSPSPGSQQNTGKTVAIILGGAAGVGFLLICMLFTRNVMKKHDDY
ncbi:plasmodesmata-located protein 2-like [Ipomoea triloba]|uniref:plasmodesmata-located protein 2-like n=1 Tax=Ipomoea triloba TaxID=35885 RepID=UPI00125E6A7D|nr:plasmodesmata-located protein 2-like [Ipomoea triloba]